MFVVICAIITRSIHIHFGIWIDLGIGILIATGMILYVIVFYGFCLYVVVLARIVSYCIVVFCVVL